TVSGSKNLVATGTVADRGPGLAEPLHLRCVEASAMRKPGPRIQTTAIFQIIERAAVIKLFTEPVFVLGLGEMGMHADVEFFGELGRLLHQRRRHRKRRTGR